MKLFLSFLLLICFINPCFAFSFKKKKQVVQTPKMVETKQEWEIEAQNVPLKDRKPEVQQAPKSDKKNYFPEVHYAFEKYNYPAGKREYDIRFIKKNLVEHPIMVADLNCRYVAYANYYYRADIDQIYSDFYVEKLDTKKDKTQRIIDYNHKQLERTPVLTSGFREEYNHLFNGLSLVDWSMDSKKVLIKENIGSTIGGIYKTKLYVYFLNKDKTMPLSALNDYIENYYGNYENFPVNIYRSTLVPLGFSSDNDELVLSHFYIYDKDGKKIFMGTWGFDLSTNKVILVSKTNPSASISANGLALKRVLE